jgi:RHS repeat-associated protein
MNILAKSAVAIALSASCYGAIAQTYSKTETIEYHDDNVWWVLGQVKRTTTNGVETSRTTYGWKGMPSDFYGFDNQLKQHVEFDTASSTASGQLGTLKSIADGRGQVTTATNWQRGVPQNIQFADGSTLRFAVDDRGWITWKEDELSSRTCFTYDGMGRLTSTTYPSEAPGAGANVCNTDKWTATTYTWEWIDVAEHGLPAGHWLRRVHTGNHRRNTFYDVMYRPVLVHYYDGGRVDATLQTTGTSYDAQGRPTFQSYPASSRERGSLGTWLEYDPLGRVASVSKDSELGPLITLIKYKAGFKKEVVSPGLQSTTTSYMTFDEPATDLPVLIEAPESSFTHISRDVFGKPTQIRRSNSVVPIGGTVALNRSYSYNARQELCKSVEPETGATLYGFDGEGNMAWSASGLPSATACESAGITAAVAARKVSRTYDTRNRLVSMSFPDGRGNQTWTYALTGQPTTATTYNGAGNTQPVVNAYSYNRRKLLTGESSAQTNWYIWGLGYGYDPYGNLNNVKHADGFNIVYAPNAIGQPTQVGSYASSISFFPNGALKQFTYGNGIVHTLSQNARQLPARSTDTGGMLDQAYTYDKNANLTNVIDYTAGGRQARALVYDNLNRLRRSTGPSFGVADYDYNVLDDLLRVKVTGGNNPRDHLYHYDVGHRLDSVTNYADNTMVVGLSYDVQGNLANKNGQLYDFDFGNRLLDVQSKENYRYDALGRRVYSYSNNYAVWQYNHAGRLMMSHDARNSRATNYIYLQGSLLATREYVMGGDGTYTFKYYHTDALGTPVKVSSTTGATLETSEYEPFGHLANRTLSDGIGFTGQMQDAKTGLTYMQQRYYDPVLGRFLSADPVTTYLNGDLRHYNLFSYAYNSPYRYRDLDGRCPVCGLVGAVAGGIGGGVVGLVTSGGDWKAGLAGAAGGAVGGAITGATLGAGTGTAGVIAAGVTAGILGELTAQTVDNSLKHGTNTQAYKYSGGRIAVAGMLGAGGALSGQLVDALAVGAYNGLSRALINQSFTFVPAVWVGTVINEHEKEVTATVEVGEEEWIEVEVPEEDLKLN